VTYWIHATMAEAHLVRGEPDEAERWYRQAVEGARERLGDISSTWSNARIVLASFPEEMRGRMARALDIPNVALFRGNTEDGGIRGRLVESRARVGYSSAAAGPDILFLEAMQAEQGKTYIVLPCEEEQFVRESVASAGQSWVDRFNKVRERATDVILASRQRLTRGSVAYDFASDLMHGLARLRARQYGTDLIHLGTPARGTDDPSAAGAEIRAILFADAYHFSRLGEGDMPAFLDHFMAPIAGLVRETRPAPLFHNTWGDGLYLVFRGVEDAGNFAGRLARRVAGIDRRRWGLPEDMTLRISLHAGPVYRYEDRIIGRTNYIGSHVNRAARIEPVTPPGQIYVTDAFAALAALHAPGRFRFDYVGRIPLAKGFGEYPIYRMDSTQDA
jgi:class 3 adenylate cyclase